MDEVRQRDDRIVQNAWFLAKESWRWDKRILVFLGITTVTGTALPLFGIYLELLEQSGLMVAGVLDSSMKEEPKEDSERIYMKAKKREDIDEQ